MKELELFDAVALIDEKYVDEAERHEFSGYASASRRRRFLKTFACAVGFCAALTFLAYAVPRLLPAADGGKTIDNSVQPAPIAVWNDGVLSVPAMRGGSAVKSYATATESFEYWGDFALPTEIDVDITLKNEPTEIYSVNTAEPSNVTINVSSQPIGYVGRYTYSSPAESEALVVFVYSSSEDSFSDHLVLTDEFPVVKELESYTYSVDRRDEYTYRILQTWDDDRDKVFFAQLSAPRQSEGGNNDERITVTVKSDGKISESMFELYFKRLVNAMYPDISKELGWRK